MLRLFTLDELTAHPGDRSACLAVGVFDGVHRGHRLLLKRAVDLACSGGGGGEALRTTVLTFRNHPMTLLRPLEAPPRLSTLERRLDWIEQSGVDLALALEFDAPLSRMPPVEFLRHLVVEGFRARFLVCGPDFRFGRGGGGDAALIREIGPAMGLTVVEMPPVYHDDAPISSSRIRRLVLEGHTLEAAELLGRPYEIEGRVIQGRQRGRLIGYPTANLQPPERVALPRTGVYTIEADTPAGRFGGMMNLGYSPTFGDIEQARLEAHLFDFEGDLLGATLRIHLLDFLREEIHFASVGDLIAQLGKDERQSRRRLARWRKHDKEKQDHGEACVEEQ